MKKLLMVMTLCLATLGLAGCGEKNYTVNDIVSEQELVDKGFTPINSSYSERGQAYLAEDNTFVVYYNNGVFNSAHLTSGPTVEMVNIDNNIYLSNNERTTFINANDCLIDNQAQPLDSEVCQNNNNLGVKYNEYIKNNFKQIIK